jgi:hypothetical protein
MPLRKLRALKSKAATVRGSIIKACVFVFAWMFLPWWLFIPVALYLYFVPLSQAKLVIAPFFALLVLCLAQPAGWFFAIIFGVLFWYILLIKDLYIIDRRSAYEILSLALIFLLLRMFYLDMSVRAGALAIFCAFAIAGLFAGLVGGFMKHFSPDTGVPEAIDDATHNPFRRIIIFASFLLFFQLLVIGLFLPLDFIYRSVVIFLLCTLIIEFFPRHLFGDLSRNKLLTTSSVVFVLLVLVLGSARWGL